MTLIMILLCVIVISALGSGAAVWIGHPGSLWTRPEVLLRTNTTNTTTTSKT